MVRVRSLAGAECDLECAHGDLFVLNFLTLLTEFIGVNFALAYFGVSKYYSVPIAAVMLFTAAATRPASSTASYTVVAPRERCFRFML